MAKAKAKNKKKTKKQEAKDQELYMYILSTASIVVICIALFKLGIIGIFLNNGVRFLFGDFYYAACVIGIVLAAIILFHKKKGYVDGKTIVASLCILIAILLWSATLVGKDVVGMDVLKGFLANTPEYFKTNATLAANGGLLGAILYAGTSVLIAREGTWILAIALLILAFILILSLDSFKEAAASIKKFFEVSKWREDDDEDEYAYIDVDEEEPSEAITKPKFIGSLDKHKKKSIFVDVENDGTNEVMEEEEVIAPKASIPTSPSAVTSNISSSGSRKAYRLPPLSLLQPVGPRQRSNLNQVAANEKGERLIEILGNFDIDAELIATHIGPAVTKFEVKPDSNVKVSKINSVSDNIKMELAARDIRIEAPIPGRNAVGIEIPNVEPTAVRMIELIKTVPNDLKEVKTLFVLGKDLMGKPVYCNLHKMPHLLIAGATGSGKSVCMNTIITSFLLRTTPEEVKLLLIDPKKVEFTPYQKIPHLIGPVISDAAEASRALKVVVLMMEERYEIFSRTQVRNIDSYNEKIRQFPDEKLKAMPYIVVIIDELADLMAIAGKEVEMSIQRITQLARAAGIHLIVATQRPSTDVITGIIKANIPSRIAFSVSSGIDSRTILDHIGAERLLGNGDMLYLPIGEPSAIRLQGVYVTDDEVHKIAEFCSSQDIPHFEDAFIRLEGVDNNESTAVLKIEDDPMYDEVKEYVIDSQKASTSLLQRRFGIGYNRAARMIDVLEERGIIGPAQGSKPRDVYIKRED
ncbi:DNA translocase FtsK [Anaerorhabdus sp.]|uniref:DNA translocase FtsK n=1 Tax=Anaerorhabdus sp. TaxID=1872524 RepID=UPI002FC5957B